MEYKLIDCCPVPEGLYDELNILKQDLGVSTLFSSIYRGIDARDLLAQCGKHDQAWLYANLPAGVANPPGFSTHELKSDGVAFPIARGQSIEYWMVGLDVIDAYVQRFIDAARKRGWVVTITYPGSSVEYHHVNFRKEPEFDAFDVMKQGDKDGKVDRLVKLLQFIHEPKSDGGRPYLSPDNDSKEFTPAVEDAVKNFQGDHKLGSDGVVGQHTWQQLLVSERREKNQRELNGARKDLRNVIEKLNKVREDKGNDKEQKELAERVDKLKDKVRDLGGNPGGDDDKR